MAAYQNYEDLQRVLEAKMQAQGKSVALQQLHMILVRMLKGEFAMRLHMWRAAAWHARGAVQGQQGQRVQQLQHDLQLARAQVVRSGLRILMLQAERLNKIVMVHTVQALRLNFMQSVQRRDLAEREAVAATKMAQFTTASLAMQARLGARLQEHSDKVAFGVLARMLRNARQREHPATMDACIARWVRNMASVAPKVTQMQRDALTAAGFQLLGQVLQSSSQQAYMGSVLAWYFRMRNESAVQVHKHSAIQGVQFAHSQGMRVLRNVFKLMLRGEVGLRMFIWRRNIAQEKDAKYREIRIKYEAQSRHFSQLFRR